jgi:hypothetical protein
MTAVRIASNDPALGRAMATRGLDALAAQSWRIRAQLRGLDVKRAAKMLRRHYGPLLLSEHISGADGGWVALDSLDDELIPVRIARRQVGARGVYSLAEFRLRISRHAVARVLQRTVHDPDVKLVGRVLAHHVAQASARLDDELRPGDQVTTTSPDGALVWMADSMPTLVLRARTWLGAETAIDPEIRAACLAWRAIVVRHA